GSSFGAAPPSSSRASPNQSASSFSNSPMPPRSSVGTTRRSTRRYCRAGSRMRAAAPLSSRAPDRAHPQRYALDRERQRGCRRKAGHEAERRDGQSEGQKKAAKAEQLDQQSM